MAENSETDETSIDGIPPKATDSDKNLFKLIKSKIINKAISQGHDYTPTIGEFRASSVGYCSRKILIHKDISRYLNEDEIKELNLPDYMEDELPEPGSHMAGQVLHEYIQDALADDLLSKEEEVTFEFNNIRLVGHYDLLMNDENNEKIVIDIKSTSSHRDNLPFQSHLMQLMAYQGMLGGIRGALFYINRNNWQMTYFPQFYEKNKFSLILSKLSNLAYHEKMIKLPVIDPDIFETECKTDYYMCEFFKFCFPNYIEQEQQETETDSSI